MLMLDIPTIHLSRYFVLDTEDKMAIIPQFPALHLAASPQETSEKPSEPKYFSISARLEQDYSARKSKEIYAHDRPRLLGYRFQNHTGRQSPEISPSSDSKLARPEPSDDIWAPTPHDF
jgi:hypothetical protein